MYRFTYYRNLIMVLVVYTLTHTAIEDEDFKYKYISNNITLFCLFPAGHTHALPFCLRQPFILAR